MIGAEIVCTDESCAVTADVTAESLDALELIACDDCGCTIQVLAVWDVVELSAAAPIAKLHGVRPPLAA